MKKLLFILPVLAWIGCYFVWTYSAPFVAIHYTVAGAWWLITDILYSFATIALFMFAVMKNTD